MKKALALATGLIAVATLSHTSHAADADAALQSAEQKTGYAFGQMFGRRLLSTMPGIDIESFTQGLHDASQDKPSQLSDEEITQQLQTYQARMQAEQQAKVAEMAAVNLKKGQDYLAENKEKDGVIVTDSGLQYKIVEKGSGQSPKIDDSVEVHYTGTLVNGEVFDSSVERGQTVTFPVNGVIAGWTEALQMMKPGGKWQLVIPPELAYGPNGNGRIGPNETLVFDVELIDVK